ncbi:MAG: P-II family nitrogen regulator [Rhodothermales bacterium]
MKKIEAFIKPFALEAVRSALLAEGIRCVTTADAQEFNGDRPFSERFRGTEYVVDQTPRALLVVLAPDDEAPQVVRVIRDAAQTGHPGDGRIIVTHAEEVVDLDAAVPVAHE